LEESAIQITGPLSALIIGFVLGLKHSTDADHVVAVSTIARDYKNALQSLWVGASWGLGHSTPLIITGIIVLALKESFISFYADIAFYFEIGVALMLVFLGVQVFWKIYKGEFHSHAHEHDGQAHMHIHGSHTHEEQKAIDPHYSHDHHKLGTLKSFFRLKSFSIGVMHGLAGSAAVIIAMLPTSPSFFTGLFFLIIFSIGTMAAMGIMTLMIAFPFSKSNNRSSNFASNMISVAAGTLSIIFGIALGSDLLLDTSFIWY
jgi:ABC-type nickel/cobalt efflux system permease component RcnA